MLTKDSNMQNMQTCLGQSLEKASLSYLFICFFILKYESALHSNNLSRSSRTFLLCACLCICACVVTWSLVTLMSLFVLPMQHWFEVESAEVRDTPQHNEGKIKGHKEIHSRGLESRNQIRFSGCSSHWTSQEKSRGYSFFCGWADWQA